VIKGRVEQNKKNHAYSYMLCVYTCNCLCLCAGLILEKEPFPHQLAHWCKKQLFNITKRPSAVGHWSRPFLLNL